MTAALKYEWVRLTTIRSTYWLIGLTLAFTTVVTVLVAWRLPETGPLAGGEQPLSLLLTLGASTGVAPLFLAYIIGIIGVFSMGHEYRHGMIRATLTSVPGRLAVVGAKLLTVALVAAGTALACSLIAMASGLVFGVDLPFGSAFTWKLVLGIVLYTVLFAWTGLAFAGLLRNQTAAVALLVLVPSVVESIVRAIVLAIKAASDDPSGRGGFIGVLRFMPFDAGGQMYTRESVNRLFEFLGYVPFGPLGGGIVFVVFVAILLTAMTVLFVRRDA